MDESINISTMPLAEIKLYIQVFSRSKMRNLAIYYIFIIYQFQFSIIFMVLKFDGNSERFEYALGKIGIF